MALTHPFDTKGKPTWRELAFIQKYLSGTKYLLYNPFTAEQNPLFLEFGIKDFITELKMCLCLGLWAESCLSRLSCSVFLEL